MSTKAVLTRRWHAVATALGLQLDMDAVICVRAFTGFKVQGYVWHLEASEERHLYTVVSTQKDCSDWVRTIRRLAGEHVYARVIQAFMKTVKVRGVVQKPKPRGGKLGQACLDSQLRAAVVLLCCVLSAEPQVYIGAHDKVP